MVENGRTTLHPNNNSAHIYTDGSGINGGIGVEMGGDRVTVFKQDTSTVSFELHSPQRFP
jgi:hypothetical protein